MIFRAKDSKLMNLDVKVRVADETFFFGGGGCEHFIFVVLGWGD